MTMPALAPLPEQAPTDLLQAVMTLGGRVAVLEVRVGGYENAVQLMSTHLEETMSQGTRNEAAVSELRSQGQSLLQGTTALRADVTAVKVTLERLEGSWGPSIAGLEPILRERALDEAVHKREIARQGDVVRRWQFMALLVGVAAGIVSILAALEKWPQITFGLHPAVFLALVVAVALLGALAWRLIPFRSPAGD